MPREILFIKHVVSRNREKKTNNIQYLVVYPFIRAKKRGFLLRKNIARECCFGNARNSLAILFFPFSYLKYFPI